MSHDSDTNGLIGKKLAILALGICNCAQLRVAAEGRRLDRTVVSKGHAITGQMAPFRLSPRPKTLTSRQETLL